MAVPVDPKAYLASVLVLHTPSILAPPLLLRSVDCFYGGALFGVFLVSLLQIWPGSGIPPMLSVIQLVSTLLCLLHSSLPVLHSGRNMCTAGAAVYQRELEAWLRYLSPIPEGCYS